MQNVNLPTNVLYTEEFVDYFHIITFIANERLFKNVRRIACLYKNSGRIIIRKLVPKFFIQFHDFYKGQLFSIADNLNNKKFKGFDVWGISKIEVAIMNLIKIPNLNCNPIFNFSHFNFSEFVFLRNPSEFVRILYACFRHGSLPWRLLSWTPLAENQARNRPN